MKIFGVENSMIAVAKKLRGENNENELWVVMIWKGWQMTNVWVMATEANCKALVVAQHALSLLTKLQKKKHTICWKGFFIFSLSSDAFNVPPLPYLNKTWVNG
jgi:hypothetical protein